MRLTKTKTGVFISDGRAEIFIGFEYWVEFLSKLQKVELEHVQKLIDKRLLFYDDNFVDNFVQNK